jgi:hypothetical protein
MSVSSQENQMSVPSQENQMSVQSQESGMWESVVFVYLSFYL